MTWTCWRRAENLSEVFTKTNPPSKPLDSLTSLSRQPHIERHTYRCKDGCCYIAWSHPGDAWCRCRYTPRSRTRLEDGQPSKQVSSGPFANHILKAEEHPGFTDALVDILQAEQEATVRLSSTHNPHVYPATPSSADLEYSRCLSEESRYERMVTQRRNTKQTYTRRREEQIS